MPTASIGGAIGELCCFAETAPNVTAIMHNIDNISKRVPNHLAADKNANSAEVFLFRL